MHLHHELQRALAHTKIDKSTPPHPPGLPQNELRREHPAATTRTARHLFWRRPVVGRGATTETLAPCSPDLTTTTN